MAEGVRVDAGVRADIEEFYARVYNVPCVLACVGGGPAELRAVEHALRHTKSAVLLLSDGAAAARRGGARWPRSRSRRRLGISLCGVY